MAVDITFPSPLPAPPTRPSPPVVGCAEPGCPVADLPTAQVESELLSLAGHLAAAQCRFLILLAEYDRRQGWSGPGLRSCAHWLCWRTGMSLRTGAEHVRVAHALRELPQITAAFAAGTVSYSKVRAITRIATPDTEQTLLNLALAGTASHVETVVRAARRQQADPNRATAQRSVSWSWAEDGSLILRARLPPDQGAALVAAIEARTGPPRGPILDEDPDPPEDWHNQGIEQAPGTAADRVAARRADALTTLITTAETATTANPDGTTVLRGNTQVIVHFDAATGTAKIDGGPEIPASTADRLACDAHVQLLLSDRSTNRMYLGRRRRLASPAQIAALTIRDEGRCQFAGCTTTHHLSAHHVRHWRHAGPTDIDNLVLLCGFHHGLIHDHGYRIHRHLDHWRTRRPNGTLVPTTGPPLTGSTESLHELHTREQLRITPDTLTPTWGGERLDPTPILMALLPEAA